jgi:hypothetical protein
VNYLKKFFDSNDGTASLRNAAFALVMIAGVIYLGAQLAVGLVKTGVGITGDWNMGFGILTGAATGSKLLGQKLHNDAPDPADPQKDVKE